MFIRLNVNLYLCPSCKPVVEMVNGKSEPTEALNTKVPGAADGKVESAAGELILEENEWKPLNKIAQNSDTFFAPYVMTLANLCYRAKIPLECIIQTEFKEKLK